MFSFSNISIVSRRNAITHLVLSYDKAKYSFNINASRVPDNDYEAEPLISLLISFKLW